MGLLSWLTGRKAPPAATPPSSKGDAQGSSPKSEAAEEAEAPGMNGAVKVRRPTDVTVFEFGSVAASGDRLTLAGYCPVSDELEPCRWEIVPVAPGSNAPQVRIVF